MEETRNMTKSFEKSSTNSHKRIKRVDENVINNDIDSQTTKPFQNKEDIIDIVKRLTTHYTEVIPRDVLKQYDTLNWSNGLGNRWARKIFNYATLMSDQKINLYSEHVGDTISQDIINSFYSSNVQTRKASGTVGIFVFSERRNKVPNRPISKKIRKQFSRSVCVVCGSSSNIVIDHKNDLYNDVRVLQTNLQVVSDFQPLCNHCNLQKRQICKKEKAENKLHSAKQIPRFENHLFAFPWEKKIFDICDIHCKRNTYWYDPLEFETKILYYSMYRLPINEMVLRNIQML